MTTRLQSPRALGAALAVALVSVPVTGIVEPAQAAGVPTAVCSDGRWFDGLDSRYAASYCATALTAAGYAAVARSNTSAEPVLASEATDAVFYHAGHSLVVHDGTRATALSLLYAGEGAGGTTQGLLGDPWGAYAYKPGPMSLCANGVCENITLLQLPYASAMANSTLALFQSCNTAEDGVLGYTSPATIAFRDAMVGTVIGFRDEVFFQLAPGTNLTGDAFARRFWSNTQSGKDYLTSLVDAVNASGGSQYGYTSYVYLHHDGAPTRLRPATYYVP